MWSKTVVIGGRELTFEIGEVARQSAGAVLVRQGQCVILAAVNASLDNRGGGFLPLTVDFQIRLAGAGKIPGGYLRREGRASEFEVLTARVIDRSLRPLFPDGYRFDTQVIVTVLSHDPDVDPAPLSLTAAAMALAVSDIPFDGPVAALRIGRVDGALIPLPDQSQREASELDLILAARRDGIVMVEGSARQVPEDEVVAAFERAQSELAALLDAIDAAAAETGKDKRVLADTADPEAEVLRAALAPELEPKIDAALEQAADKAARSAALRALKEEALASQSDDQRERAAEVIDAIKKSRIRERTLEGARIDGRAMDAVRAISGRARWLPTPHGSALFTRGETQAMVTCTLGGDRDAQLIETADGTEERRFLLHYNFPPYSVGETRPMRGPGRREIGHGRLAWHALAAVLPDAEAFPYTLRLDSIISESNGSSSMATVCGGCLALMDAGVPIKGMVAGIAMGLISDGQRVQILTDILGDEDHIGDMDFKVAGTAAGVTAVQLDNKIGSLSRELMARAFEQARAARLQVLDEMRKILAAPRQQVAEEAPRSESIPIPINRVRDLIGRGGKNIRGIENDTGAKVSVDDDGLVKLFATNATAMNRAKELVEDLTGRPRVGESYRGKVTAVKPFGTFVRLFEGIEGLIEADTLRGRALQQGQRIPVKVLGVSRRGRIELLLEER